jgi:hypothetical protein
MRTSVEGQSRVLEHVDLLAAGELGFDTLGMNGKRCKTANKLKAGLCQLLKATLVGGSG